MFVSRKAPLHLIYEDESQIKENCFVSQLYRTLRSRFRIIKIPRAKLLDGIPPFKSGDLALSLLKQRTWERTIPFLAKVTERCSMFYYDQDPWEAYYSQASSPGIYAKLARATNVRSFLVTSKWWRDYIAETDGLPIKFVRMGMLQNMCDAGPRFEKRPIEIGFQGTLHRNRKRFFDRMSGLGIDVTFRPSVPYRKFLTAVQDIQIFLHHEALPDGSPMNGIWIKEVESAARGLFSIRNFDPDYDAYDMQDILTVYAFRQETEVPDIIETIRSLPENQRNEMIRESVSEIKRRNDWNSVADALIS